MYGIHSAATDDLQHNPSSQQVHDTKATQTEFTVTVTAANALSLMIASASSPAR